MIRINRELLQYVDFLYGRETAGGVVEQIVATGQEIIPQGKNVSGVYIIKSGLAKCYLTEDNGRDFIQEFFGEGELFGEIEVLHNTISFCCVASISEMVLYKIPHADFYLLLKKDNTFNELIMKALAAKVRYKAIRHAYHQSHTAEDNVLRLHSAFPMLTQKISKPDLANYLGITLRSLNRTLNDLRKRNLLRER